MPELPEVEAVCRRLRRDAPLAAIVAVHFPRPAICVPQSHKTLARKIAGRSIESIDRRGKHILIHLSGSATLHIHLGMTGDLYVVSDIRFRPASARAWFDIEDGRAILYTDPRALGRIHIHPTSDIDRHLSHIGIEPLDPSFTAATLAALAHTSRSPVKAFLLDQRHIAGIGNIYAAEALFQARIDPRRISSSLSRPRLHRLHAAIVDVLRRAVESATLAYMQPGRFGEAEWFPLAVYGREGEPCLRCGRPIKRIVQSGRSTCYCPGCQK
jgi:formamidopyrimidine-DNA glycosylase